MNEDIEDADYIDHGTQVATMPSPDSPTVEVRAPTQVMNPLDAPVQQFGQALQQRKDNYDQLREYLRNHLVRGLDFDRIHIANKDKCPQPWNCSYEQNRGHYTDYQLLDPGADKILGVLGLAVKYEGIKGYQAATLKGIQIMDVILPAYIVNSQGTVIAEGSGAAGRKEHKGDLSNTIKKAQKKARVDAVKRLPSVSALFDGDFFDSIIGEVDRPAHKPTPTAAQREADGPAPGPGRLLETYPMGKHKGKRFTDLDTNFLHWILTTIKDKPDIVYSATTELERRKLQDDTVQTGAPRPAPTPNQQMAMDASDGSYPAGEHDDFINAAFGDKEPSQDDAPPMSSYEGYT